MVDMANEEDEEARTRAALRAARAAVEAHRETHREALRTMERLLGEHQDAVDAHEAAWTAKRAKEGASR
jgi:hypothetical protein